MIDAAMLFVRGVRNAALPCLIVLILLLSSCEGGPSAPPIGTRTQQARYGSDFTSEISSGPSKVKSWAESVGMLTRKSVLPSCSTADCDEALCSGPYDDQPSVGYCTAFQIGPDLWATAGHCILPQQWEKFAGTGSNAYAAFGCGSVAVVRNAQENDLVASGGEVTVDEDKILNCVEVVSHGPRLPGNVSFQKDVGCERTRILEMPVNGTETLLQPCSLKGNPHDWPFCHMVDEVCYESQSLGDWAVFRVDEVDTDWDHYLPTSMISAGFWDEGQSLTLLQHPAGMPMKYDSGNLKMVSKSVPTADRTNRLRRSLIGAPLDNLGGSSGGPLFGSASGIVRGIATRGAMQGRRDGDTKDYPLTDTPVSGASCIEHIEQCKDPDDPASTGINCPLTQGVSSERIYVEGATEDGSWPPKTQDPRSTTPFFVGLTLGAEGDFDSDGDQDSLQFIYTASGVQVVATVDDVARDCSVPGCNLYYVGYMQYGPGVDRDPGDLINGSNLLSGYFSNPHPLSSLPDFGPDLLMQLDGTVFSTTGDSVREAFDELASDIASDPQLEGGNVTDLNPADEPTLKSYLEIQADAVGSEWDDYTRLEIINVDNVKQYDDVLAVRADGTYDVYCGGRNTPSGLELCNDDFLAIAATDSSGDGESESFSIRVVSGVNFVDVHLRQRFSECAGVSVCNEHSSDELILDGGNGDAVRNNPSKMVAGNFNGDSRLRTDWDLGAEYRFPTNDLVVLVGGYVMYFESNGYAAVEFQETLWSNPWDWTTPAVDIDPTDMNRDGFDDLIVTLHDGSKRVFWGSLQGLTAGNYSILGAMPTADGHDGKFIMMSGPGLATFPTLETHMKIQVQASDTEVAVQLFDADMGGYFEQNLAQGVNTCFQLWSDPCEDLSADCFADGFAGGPELVVAGLSSSDMTDDGWRTIFAGAQNAFTPAPSGDYIYRLIAYFSEDDSCDEATSAISTTARDAVDPSTNTSALSPDSAENLFKLRSNGDVSYRFGQLKLIGMDGDENPEWNWARSTTFDGSLDLYFTVSDSVDSSSQINISEADADDPDATPPGVTTNLNSDIEFSLIGPSGPVKLLRSDIQEDEDAVLSEDPSPTAVVEIPSGNYNSDDDQSVVYYRVKSEDEEAGNWNWHWDGVHSYNAIMMWTPTASPVTYEVYGIPTSRRQTSSVRDANWWLTRDDATLSSYLPLIVGRASQSGLPLGDSVEVVNPDAVRSILSSISDESFDLLLRELLVVELNLLQAESAGERLSNALVYGSTRALSSVLTEARGSILGPQIIVDAQKQIELSRLLKSANAGFLSYFRPGVPYPADLSGDDDGDGVANANDNCPTVANPLQEDSNLDAVGDACSVMPVTSCVLPRGGDDYLALFGYENPLSYRSIPFGSRNRFSGASDRGQPITFDEGLLSQVFSVEFSGVDPLEWTLEGQVAVASATSPRCLGNELVTIEGINDVALYASQQLLLRDGATVRSAGEPGSVVSGDYTEIGVVSISGNLWSRGDVFLRNQAEVNGNLITAGSLSTQAGATVAGQTAEGAYVPSHDLRWEVDFPASASNVILEPDTVQTLSPGAYGSVDVRSHSILRLKSGVYHFESFRLEPQADLSLDQSAGQVVIYVRDVLTLRGEIADEANNFPNLMIGYFGSGTASLSAPYKGSLIAPNGRINLEAVGSEGHQGVFFAKIIEVAPYTSVTYVAPGMPYLDPSPLSCGDGTVSGDETDLDCGGSCEAGCIEGQSCAVSSDCESLLCVSEICEPAYFEVSCSEENAVDLGAPGAGLTQANDGCIMIRDAYPSWWGTRTMQLQTGGGGLYDLPFTWSNACTNGGGTGLFTGPWQSQFFGPTASGCATVIDLQGGGDSDVTLRYY